MADAGFAEPAGAVQAATAPTEGASKKDGCSEVLGIPVKKEVKPVDLVTTTIDMLEEQVATGLPSMSVLTNSLLPTNARKKIVHDELNKIIEEQFGEDAGKFLKVNKWMYDTLHEQHRAAIEGPLAEGLSNAIDKVADDLLKRSTAPINRNNIEESFSNSKKFVTWVDCLIRELFAHVASGTSVPGSVTFELLDGAEHPSPNGIKLTCTWRSADTPRGRGMSRGNHMCLANFPWLGRNALFVAKDADKDTKELVHAHRRLYIKAVLVALKNAFPS